MSEKTISRLETVIADLNTSYVQMQAESVSLRSDLSNVRGDFGRLEKQIGALADLLQATKSGVGLVAQVQTLEGDIQELKEGQKEIMRSMDEDRRYQIRWFWGLAAAILGGVMVSIIVAVLVKGAGK